MRATRRLPKEFFPVRERRRLRGARARVKERSEEHTSELQSRSDLVCRLLLEKKKKIIRSNRRSRRRKSSHAYSSDAGLPWRRITTSGTNSYHVEQDRTRHNATTMYAEQQTS